MSLFSNPTPLHFAKTKKKQNREMIFLVKFWDGEWERERVPTCPSTEEVLDFSKLHNTQSLDDVLIR